MSPFRPWRTVAASLTLLAVAAAPAAASPSSTTSLSGPKGTSTSKVLVIGVDGTRWDVLRAQMAAGRAPNLKALADGGFLTPTSVPSGGKLDQTLSGPSWNAILSGVWEDKHRVDSNSDCDYDHHEAYPDVLTRLERARPSLSTFAAATWGTITTTDGCGPDVSDEADANYHPAGTATDAATAGEAARYIAANGPDAGFVHLDQVDEAGHASGGTSQAYRDAVAAADVQVGRLIAAIKARPSYASERWQVLVTTDHGHLDAGGHGGATAAERTSWIIGDELGAVSNELPAQSGVVPGGLRGVDLAPTVLRHLGVTPQASWGLDGRAIGTGGGDVFDTRAGALSPAASETPDPYSNGPGQLYGFTHTPPAGWSVVNGSNTSQGVSEWRGWSFTTDPFWTAAQRAQGREDFGSGRGVFAVADGDEWNDTSALASAPQTLDTTLVSPGYDVTGARTATVSFDEAYRQTGSQVAEVSVSFDGGARSTVQRYSSSTSDANAGADVRTHRASRTVTVPSGARAMVVRWRYAGGNDWYWAVDDPRVTTTR